MSRSLLHAIAAVSAAEHYQGCCGETPADPCDHHPRRPSCADQRELRGGGTELEFEGLYSDGMPYACGGIMAGAPRGTVLRREGVQARWHVLAVLSPAEWAESALAARIAAFAHTHEAVDFRVITPVQANALLTRRRLDPVDPPPLFILLNAAFEEVSSWGEGPGRQSPWWWLPLRRATPPASAATTDEFVATLEHLAA